MVPAMTNRIALLVAFLVLVAVLLDLWLDWNASLFLMREIDGLVGWLAFWH